MHKMAIGYKYPANNGVSASKYVGDQGFHQDIMEHNRNIGGNYHKQKWW